MFGAFPTMAASFYFAVVTYTTLGYGDIVLAEDLRALGAFRSTFRDWCSEGAHAEREVAEAALSHATGNEVERAYARSDLFKRRRTLMDTWGLYATGKAGDVVQMVRS